MKNNLGLPSLPAARLRKPKAVTFLSIFRSFPKEKY
jgi:hypothetical protein